MRNSVSGLWVGLCSGLFLLLAPLAGQAASFDCAKARAKIEKAICADKELSALDERMAAAYKKQLGAWQGGIAAGVRYDQVEFNKIVRSAHEGEIEDAFECNKAYVSCIKKMLRERVDVLESTAYPLGGVYQRGNAKLLLRPLAGEGYDVVLFRLGGKETVVLSTLKSDHPDGMKVKPGAAGYTASDMLVSQLGDGVAGTPLKEACEVRLRMSSQEAEITQTGKCGANFAGKYKRNLKDRVDDYAQDLH